uniref:RRM domain-containing protein n=2 Tax=Opuntia streptacantha TaxID=393608 RepID=A0A7C9DZP4_OPUST
MAATSFFLSSLTPTKTLPLSIPLAPLSSTSSFSLPTFTATQQPNSLSFPLAKRFDSISSRFVPNVAISSEYGQDEEEDFADEQPEFSPELRLFVGNLPFSVDSAQLADLFGSVGVVEMVEVIYDKFTGRSRGFGFVTMSTAQEVEAAATKFNGYELDGRQIRVNAGPPPPKDSAPRFPRGGSPSSENRVHVSNLSWKVDDAALKNLFSDMGEVLEARVIYDRDTGRSRGFGFVTYSSAEEVNNAIESLDGVDLNGRPIRVAQAEVRRRI